MSPAFRSRSLPLAAALTLAACADHSGPHGLDRHPDLGTEALSSTAAATASAIRHVVVIVQENHSFDTYFGRYCLARPGSSPTCTDGPACCEAGPDAGPGGEAPVTLDDAANAAYDPRHDRACELAEMHGGAMDRFVGGAVAAGVGCGERANFAYAPDALVAPYHALARRGALADRYFQPVAGKSSANDMFFARAGFVFDDNEASPTGVGVTCSEPPTTLALYTEPTIADLLAERGVSMRFYAEGYGLMSTYTRAGECPPAPPDCPAGVSGYPCTYDPSDDPFTYYRTTFNDDARLADLLELGADLDGGRLPSVSFVRGLGYHSEHPGSNLGDGVAFVASLVARVEASPYAADTLVLVTWDESGGYFDHVAPPPPAPSDGQPYGPRVPLLAIGPFARRGAVSHVPLEHSSLVKFIEWNWLDGRTGQLGTRDAHVANLGSLLDPARTGAVVPVD